MEQQALVSVYINGGATVCQGSEQPCLTFSSSVCVLSVRYKVPSPVLPAVLVGCVASGAPSDKALGSEELGSTWLFYPAETSAAHVVGADAPAVSCWTGTQHISMCSSSRVFVCVLC